MRSRGALMLMGTIVAVGGCGGSGGTVRPAPTRAADAAVTRPAHGPPSPAVLRVVRTARLPAAVQLPAVTVRAGGEALALGGLDSADTSTAAVVHLTPGPTREIAPLPVALHDAGAASIGRTAYVFGGGTASGSLDAVTRIDGGTVGRLAAPASDLEAVTIGRTAYAVGGYDGAAALATITAWRPGRPAHIVATLPHALRYAAVGVDHGRIVVAGGTDGTTSQRAIYRVDVRTGRVQTIGQLPVAISHLAGGVLGSDFFLLGGRTRGDATRPRAAILAVDLRSGRVRRAGRLPRPLSDAGVAVDGGGLLMVGGRDAAGNAADELLRLVPG